MRLPILRTLPVLALAAIATGFAHVPASTVAQSASSSSYLRVNVSCSGVRCEAWAQGGSGSYVDWEWSGADEQWEAGFVSSADATPYCVPGLVLEVLATVTDSNGGSASGSALVFCPFN
jgi:hypothetical protein